MLKFPRQNPLDSPTPPLLVPHPDNTQLQCLPESLLFASRLDHILRETFSTYTKTPVGLHIISKPGSIDYSLVLVPSDSPTYSASPSPQLSPLPSLLYPLPFSPHDPPKPPICSLHESIPPLATPLPLTPSSLSSNQSPPSEYSSQIRIPPQPQPASTDPAVDGDRSPH